MEQNNTTAREVRQAYLAVRDQLLRYENVIGVGFGAKEQGGRLTQQLAIIVFVTKKLPRDQVPEGQLLPTSLRGVPVDVREPRLTEEEHREFLERNDIPLEQGECNIDHFFLSDSKIHELNRERLRRQRGGLEPRDPNTAVFKEIFVIEDDGTLISGSTIDHVAAYNLFRTQFGDHYDFVFFHYDTASGVPGPGNSSPTIYNTITGINHYRGDSYDDRATWSSTKIQSYQKITGLTQVRRTLHETAHRWCAYVYHREGGAYSENLHEDFSDAGQALYHWGTWFDNNCSCMDYDYFDWVNSSIVSGEFEQDALTAGAPGTDEFCYHPLDLYLMGLMSGAEVGTFRYIQNPADPDNNGSYAGTQVNLTIANVTDEEGVRSPAYPNTQRIFHQAFILITNNLSGIGSLTSGVLGNFETYRAGLVDAFRRATNSRAMIDGSLLHTNFGALYIRDNSSDTGTPQSTGAFWDSPDIWVRNADDGGTAHQDTMRDQDNYVHARIRNSSGTNYEDVTVRFYRANFTGTEFYYPEDWHPNQLIGEDTITVAAGGSAVAKVTWEASFIPDETWHPCLLVEVIPMEVTPENRHHVWENRKLGQKNINIVNPPGDVETLAIEFAFGHPTRLDDEMALLTIARTIDLPGLELFLDPDGLELTVESDRAKLPGTSYLPTASEGITPSGPRYTEGITLTFPQNTDIIVGGGECSEDLGCLVVTLCNGTRVQVRTLGQVEGSPGKLTPIYREGRLIYRLPRAPLVGLQVPIKGRGRAMMMLHLDLSRVPGAARGGLVQLVQSEVEGEVVGGLDVHIRP